VDSVRHADDLFDNVKAPQEATMDAQLLLRASTMGAQKARSMKSGIGAFDIDEFVSKLITFMGGRKQMDQNLDDSDVEDDTGGDAPLDWEKIGRKALAKSRRVPVMDFMLGPLDMEQKKRANVKRSKLEKNKEEERRPQELKEEDIARSENETTKNVVALERLLEGQDGRINLFRFVINPNDFAQSVENIFYLSFLIRDGKVAFETNEYGEPEIYVCEPPDTDQYREGLTKRQMMLEFDMATWKRAIEVFNITEATIPQRPPAKTKLGDKWYG